MLSLFRIFVFQFVKLKIMNAFMILGVVGPWQIILILAVVLLLFGGKKIPELMKGLGQGAREFKKGMNGEGEEEKKKDELKKD
jgi:sec-independent protein translocase protein TatA